MQRAVFPGTRMVGEWLPVVTSHRDRTYTTIGKSATYLQGDAGRYATI